MSKKFTKKFIQGFLEETEFDAEFKAEGRHIEIDGPCVYEGVGAERHAILVFLDEDKYANTLYTMLDEDFPRLLVGCIEVAENVKDHPMLALLAPWLKRAVACINESAVEDEVLDDDLAEVLMHGGTGAIWDMDGYYVIGNPSGMLMRHLTKRQRVKEAA